MKRKRRRQQRVFVASFSLLSLLVSISLRHPASAASASRRTQGGAFVVAQGDPRRRSGPEPCRCGFWRGGEKERRAMGRADAFPRRLALPPPLAPLRRSPLARYTEAHGGCRERRRQPRRTCARRCCGRNASEIRFAPHIKSPLLRRDGLSLVGCRFRRSSRPVAGRGRVCCERAPARPDRLCAAASCGARVCCANIRSARAATANRSDASARHGAAVLAARLAA